MAVYKFCYYIISYCLTRLGHRCILDVTTTWISNSTVLADYILTSGVPQQQTLLRHFNLSLAWLFMFDSTDNGSWCMCGKWIKCFCILASILKLQTCMRSLVYADRITYDYLAQLMRESKDRSSSNKSTLHTWTTWRKRRQILTIQEEKKLYSWGQLNNWRLWEDCIRKMQHCLKHKLLKEATTAEETCNFTHITKSHQVAHNW